MSTINYTDHYMNGGHRSSMNMFLLVKIDLELYINMTNLISVSSSTALASVKRDGGCRMSLGVDVVNDSDGSHSIPLGLLPTPPSSQIVRSNAGLDSFFVNIWLIMSYWKYILWADV